MPQLHFYVPAEVAADLRRRARRMGMPLSRYLAQVAGGARRRGWPAGYFTRVVGGWKGTPPRRPAQGEFEKREAL